MTNRIVIIAIGLLVATVLVAYTLVDRANQRADTAENVTTLVAEACERRS